MYVFIFIMYKSRYSEPFSYISSSYTSIRTYIVIKVKSIKLANIFIQMTIRVISLPKMSMCHLHHISAYLTLYIMAPRTST